MIRVSFLFFLLLLSSSIFGQENYGYINYSKVVEVLPEYSSGQNHIQLTEKKYIDTLRAFQKKMENYLNRLPHNVKIDSIQKAKIEDSLMAIQEEFQKFQVLANEEIEKEQTILDEKIKTLIASKLKLFCSEYDIVCVHEEESILYCSECMDYTSMFIEFLKK